MEESSHDDLFRPDRIAQILDRSTKTYEIASGDVAPIELADVVPTRYENARPIDPYLEVALDRDDRVRLVTTRPPPEIALLFERANAAHVLRDFELAGALYTRAVQLEPDYFKAYTKLGTIFNQLGQLNRAEVVLAKAVELNPIDYQAHLMLGDTYLQMRDYRRAKDSLVRAYMLNRTDPAVEALLDEALARLGLRIRSHRLAPPIAIDRRGERVMLRFDKAVGLRWLALSACLACWAFESECGQRADEEADPLRLSMYRECLINQAASTAVRMSRDDEPIGSDEKRLLGAIESGHLEAIIFWEVIAVRAPIVILLLPDPVKEQIVEYIERYVLESTRVI